MYMLRIIILFFANNIYLWFETSPGWWPCWRVFNHFFYSLFCGQVGEKGGGGGGGGGGGVRLTSIWWGSTALSSNVFNIWCRIQICRPSRVFRRFKRRSCLEWICLNSIKISQKFVPMSPINDYTALVFFYNGLVSTRRQTIVWTNDQ